LIKRNWFTLFLAVVFSATLWPMSVYFFIGLVRQAATGAWPAAQGEVLDSHVVSHRGRKSTTYRPEVTFRYTVDGRSYTADTVTRGTTFADSSSYAQRVVNSHPRGRRVSVHYNPDNPAEAVLLAGFGDREWAVTSLQAVFLSAPCTVWLIFAMGAAARQSDRVGTVRVMEPAPGVTVIRAVNVPAWVMASIGWYLGLIGTVVAALAIADKGVVWYVLPGWAAAAALAATGYGLRRTWINAGRCDHVVDTTVTPPVFIPARGRSAAVHPVDLARVTDTAIRQDSRISTNKKQHFRVHLVINGRAATLPLVDIQQRGDAEAFDSWLRARLGLPGDP